MMNYAVRQIGDITILDLSGQISPGRTIADRCALRDLVSEQVNSGHNKVLLNLRDISHIDSSGLGDLVNSLQVVQGHSGELRVCNANGQVGLLLSRTHLDSVLSSEGDEYTALQSFGRSAG